MQAIIRRPAAEQISYRRLRQWQKFRGWKLRILEDLEHSGGKTTRSISDGIGRCCHVVETRLCEMIADGLVERVERWGWRITLDGIQLLQLQTSTTIAQQQHGKSTGIARQDVSGTFQAHSGGEIAMPQQISPQEMNAGPPCFQAMTCHIKRLCKDKRYTLTNQERVCSTCIHDDLRRDRSPRVPQEMKVVGSEKQPQLAEVQFA